MRDPNRRFHPVATRTVGESFTTVPARRFEQPEDFVVEELPLYRPAGSGGHTFLLVEKRLADTERVARELARAAGVSPREVGYAGRKDRVAVARQWFSVPGLDPECALSLRPSGARVLEAARHPHKLRTGQLRANRFRITLRGVAEADAGRAVATLGRITRTGLPNRFGPQRFGRDGRNPERARALLRGGLRRSDRRTARFLLSALQAAVFNDALEARPLSPDALESGDVAVVHASGGLFRVEDVQREAPRARRFEISATGPIFGSRPSPRPGGAVAERERAVLAAHGLSPDEAPALRGVRLRGGRRALRIRPEDAALSRVPDGLELRVTLPAGSYATVLLEALFPEAASAVRIAAPERAGGART